MAASEGKNVEDRNVLERINQLVAEEHALLAKAEGDSLIDGDQRRLQSVQVMWDQCWDFLRQRRAHREFGQNPATARARDATIVEGYQQ